MELVDSLDEMFQWRTPFCVTRLNDVMGPEGSIPGLDAMLVDIELPEISLGPEQAAPPSHANPSSISLLPPNPVSIPLLPSYCNKTIRVVTSAIQAPASIRNPLAVNTNSKPCSVQTGTRGFEIPAPTTAMTSSASNTPPVVKPKRTGRSRTAKPKCTPKKKKSSKELGLDAAGSISKANRAPTTAEHIIRERQRRDDMSAKYSILESLLPPAPKQREKAVVVEDAISFVKALEQKKAQLLNRRADLKLMASYNQSTWCKKTRSLAPLCGPLAAIGNPSQCIMTKQRPSPENWTTTAAFTDGVVVRADPVIVTSAGTIRAIHVHIGEEEVVVEMVWNRPRPNFESALLQAVQSLGFDVTRCSISRVGNGYRQCVVTCSKSQALSQRISEIQSSSTLIIRALRNMLSQSS